MPGGMPATASALVAAAQAPPGQVTSWSVTGIGRTTLTVALAALSAGGHLRVGMEDTVNFARGKRVAQFVERAAHLTPLAQRPPITTTEAHAFLTLITPDPDCHPPGG
ncbi:3-keto-5-aminohexanoate cleavage protein [Streptosporangium sp. NPDC004631]